MRKTVAYVGGEGTINNTACRTSRSIDLHRDSQFLKKLTQDTGASNECNFSLSPIIAR